MNTLVVYLDGEPHTFFQGAEVWMLAARLPPAQREAWQQGRIFLADGHGDEVGSGGALINRQSYWTRPRDCDENSPIA